MLVYASLCLVAAVVIVDDADGEAVTDNDLVHLGNVDNDNDDDDEAVPDE